MDDEGIRVYSSELGFTVGEKPPPKDNSDAWCCAIEAPGGEEDIQVYLYNRAKQAILEHAKMTSEREVGGALVGDVYKHRRPGQAELYAYIEITNAVRGGFTLGSSGSLTFTPDTWSQMLLEVEDSFPNQRIVGWYHTHPRLGVFLSEADRFIQNSFFDEGGQLALVVDHANVRGRFFIGSEKDEWGILQSDEFTWDDRLYQITRERPEVTRPDNFLVRARDRPHVSEETTTASVVAAREAGGRRPRQGGGRRLSNSRLGREDAEQEPHLSDLGEQDRPSLEVGEGEQVIRIGPDDLDGYEVQRSLEEQQATRRWTAAYRSQYQDAALRSELLYRPGCILTLAASIPPFTVLLWALLAGRGPLSHRIPQFPTMVGGVDSINAVVCLTAFFLIPGLIFMLASLMSHR